MDLLRHLDPHLDRFTLPVVFSSDSLICGDYLYSETEQMNYYLTVVVWQFPTHTLGITSYNEAIFTAQHVFTNICTQYLQIFTIIYKLEVIQPL